MSKIQEAIQKMTVEEMKQRLAAYMAADKEWAPKPVAIEVRYRDQNAIGGSNKYDVIVLKDDDTEEVIQFGDRYSKLIYIYTLMHPKGYQRRILNKRERNFPELTSLYQNIYSMADTERLVKQATKNFDHVMNMAISFIRKAFKNKIGLEELSIGNPREYNGMVVIPAVYDGLEVILDSELAAYFSTNT